MSGVAMMRPEGSTHEELTQPQIPRDRARGAASVRTAVAGQPAGGNCDKVQNREENAMTSGRMLVWKTHGLRF